MMQIIDKNRIIKLKMPLIKGIFFALCFSNSLIINAQFFDTIKVALKSKPSVDVRYDSRISFITTHPASISGIKIGLNYNKRVKFGLGYNWLQSSFLKEKNYININGELSTGTYKLHLNYISPYFEYTYFESKKFELSILVLLGFGKAYYKPLIFISGMQTNLSRSGLITMYEPHSIGIYKIMPWLGIGVGIGYRLVLIGNRAINENFNSPTFIFKTKIYSSEIIKYFK